MPSRSAVRAPAVTWSMRGRCWYAFHFGHQMLETAADVMQLC